MPGHDTNAPDAGWFTRATESASVPGLTWIVRLRSAVSDIGPQSLAADRWVSVARTVKVKSPFPVGVPAITPLDERLSPLGKLADPGASAHVYGGNPPPACNCAEYATLFVASARLAVVTRKMGSGSALFTKLSQSELRFWL